MDDYFSLLNTLPFLAGDGSQPFKILQSPDAIQAWQKQRRLDARPAEWAKLGIIWDGPYVVILRDLVEFSNGHRNGYLRLYNRAYLEGGAAGVVMLPERNGQLLLMHQFRHATRSWHWEIPRGFGEPGVEAQEQARAEIKEEIGGEIREIVPLGLYYNNTGLEGNPIYLFLVRMASVSAPRIEEGVDRLRWVSVSELEEMITREEISDGFTIAAYTRAKLKGLI